MDINEAKLNLIKNIFPKVKYNRMLEKYILPIDAYILLNLSKEELDILEIICQEHNIELEKLPKKLTAKETAKLFEEYHHIKEELSNNLSNKRNLEQQLIDVRDKIALGHMEYVYKIILKNLSSIEKYIDKEDIYQIGYEALISFIDKFDSSKNVPFISFISQYILGHIIQNMPSFSITLNRENNTSIYYLIKGRGILEEKLGRTPTNEELADYLSYDINEVEYFTSFLDNTSLLSIEEIINNQDNTPNELIDDNFEEQALKDFYRKRLIKIVKTLPSNQDKVILMYYGLLDGKKYTLLQIANILGISEERVRQKINEGLFLLRNTIRLKYLEETLKEDASKKYSKYLLRIRELELFLIKSIPKNDLLEIIDKLKPNSKEILKLYLGLIDDVEYSPKEIEKKLGLSRDVVSNRIKNALSELRYSINCYYLNKSFPKTNALENMMIDYLNKPNKTR